MMIKTPADAAAADVERLAHTLEAHARALRTEAAAARAREDRRSFRRARRVALDAAADALRAGKPLADAVTAALLSGSGLPPKTVDAIVRAARSPGRALARAERERRVMVLYRQGRSNAEIAAAVGLSASRVSRILTQARRLK